MLGDSRRPETTQFDMVKAFVFLAGLRVLPFRAKDQIDIVNVDFVADAISTLHMKADPEHEASLMKVFMPYLVWNTVFDNTRVTSELGRKPVPFSQYSYPLLKFSRDTNFSYPYQDWPAKVGGSAA